MKMKKMIANAIRENPEVAVVLEISARAREIEQREPVLDLRPPADLSATPTAAQGSIHCSGRILADEGYLIA